MTITIPDAKEQLVIDARNAYNLRAGQSLTTVQYVKNVLRRGVVNELIQARGQQISATVSAKQEECSAYFNTVQGITDQMLEQGLQGWGGD
jgi:hypothetical protein